MFNFLIEHFHFESFTGRLKINQDMGFLYYRADRIKLLVYLHSFINIIDPNFDFTENIN